VKLTHVDPLTAKLPAPTNNTHYNSKSILWQL